MSEAAKAWYDRWPKLLDWELARFLAWGIDAQVDQKRREAGQLTIRCETSLNGKPVPIEVRYPSEYPELPPMVFGPPGLIDRHQHRFGGNFCLLPRPLDDWPAGTWGAADLIGERLTALFKDTEAGPETVRAAEAPMPEPVSSYYGTAEDAAVLIAEEVRPKGERGRLRVRRCAPHMFVTIANDSQALGETIGGLLPGGEEFEVPWVRLSEPPPAGPDGAKVARWLADEHPGLLATELPPKLRDSRRLSAPPVQEFCCLVFPEEGPGVGEIHDGYLFLYVDRRNRPTRQILLRAQPLSPSEAARRRPELAGLERSRALVVGVGAIGGDIAVELAKAGVGEIDLIDYDMLEAGNLMRHRLGFEFAGASKARAVAIACRRGNPYCKTITTELHLGSTEWTGDNSLEQLAGAVGTADVVVDASGSHQISQLVGRLCAEGETPMLAAWLTEGFHGAEVVRIRPGETMCWNCFANAQRRGNLLSAESGPPSQVAALGCSHPTTSGAGFDALEVAAVATRLAAQTLEPTGGYPDSIWDHAVINFRRAHDDHEAPRFAAETLAPSEDCETCGANAGSTATR